MSDNRRYQWYRQRKKRGFDDRETWSLDHTIAKFALPRLVRFKEVNPGYPGCLTKEKWDSILDKIIFSMQAVLEEYDGKPWPKNFKAHQAKIHSGLVLFGKYFRNLWW